MRRLAVSRRRLLQGARRLPRPCPPRSPPACWRRRRQRRPSRRLSSRRRARRAGSPSTRPWTFPWPRGSPRPSRRGIPASRCASNARARNASISASSRSAAATSRRSTWSTARMPRISSSGSATAGWRPICPRRRPSISPPSYRDPDGMHITTRIWLSSLGYNTRLVRAEEAPKSFADLLDPKWAGQDGQGAPRLQRHDHDGDLPDRARTRLGVPRKACPAEGHAGAVVDRPAQEAGGRRARRDGGRQRLQSDPAQGAGGAGGGRLSGRGNAADQRAFGRIRDGAQSQRRAPVLQLAARAPRRSSCWSTSPPSTLGTPRCRRNPAGASSPTSS